MFRQRQLRWISLASGAGHALRCSGRGNSDGSLSLLAHCHTSLSFKACSLSLIITCSCSHWVDQAVIVQASSRVRVAPRCTLHPLTLWLHVQCHCFCTSCHFWPQVHLRCVSSWSFLPGLCSSLGVHQPCLSATVAGSYPGFLGKKTSASQTDVGARAATAWTGRVSHPAPWCQRCTCADLARASHSPGWLLALRTMLVSRGGLQVKPYSHDVTGRTMVVSPCRTSYPTARRLRLRPKPPLYGSLAVRTS